MPMFVTVSADGRAHERRHASSVDSGSRLLRQRVQDVDRPHDIQALTQPRRHCSLRVQTEPLRIVPRTEDVDDITRRLRRRWDLGQAPAIRSVESKLGVGLSIQLVALLVDGAMVPATEQRKIRERGGASVGPVTDVMALAEANPAAREATAAVAMVERAPYRRRDRAGAGRDLDRAARSEEHTSEL